MAKHPGVPTVPLALTPVETKALNDPTNVARFSRAARIFHSTRKFELDPTKVKIQRTSVELPNLAILPFSKGSGLDYFDPTIDRVFLALKLGSWVLESHRPISKPKKQTPTKRSASKPKKQTDKKRTASKSSREKTKRHKHIKIYSDAAIFPTRGVVSGGLPSLGKRQ